MVKLHDKSYALRFCHPDEGRIWRKIKKTWYFLPWLVLPFFYTTKLAVVRPFRPTTHWYLKFTAIFVSNSYGQNNLLPAIFYSNN
jgi:hypothetical protein